MALASALRARFEHVTQDYAPDDDSVAVLRKFVPSPAGAVVALAVGRVVIGSVVLAAPVTSARVLGLDSATAKRVTYLARMTAVRDLGLGAGTLATDTDEAALPWVVASAAADTVDALAIAAALRSGAARGVIAAGVVAGAATSAAVGFWAASRLRR